MGRWPGHAGRLNGCGLSGERRRAERGRGRGRARRGRLWRIEVGNGSLGWAICLPRCVVSYPNGTTAFGLLGSDRRAREGAERAGPGRALGAAALAS